MEDLASEGWTYRKDSASGLAYWERPVEGEDGTVERRYDDASQTTRVIGYPVGLGEAALAAPNAQRSANPAVPTSALVTFSPEARQQILDSAGWDTGNDREQRETGGPLLGVVHGSRVEVLKALTGTRNRSEERVELKLHSHGRIGMEVVGDWHSHGSDDGRPSETDRDGWDSAYRSARGKTGAPFWIAVIAEAPKYRTPILRAWTVNLDGIHPFTID
jgi:proteasome lid subunit RPN8/RPN11